MPKNSYGRATPVSLWDKTLIFSMGSGTRDRVVYKLLYSSGEMLSYCEIEQQTDS